MYQATCLVRRKDPPTKPLSPAVRSVGPIESSPSSTHRPVLLSCLRLKVEEGRQRSHRHRADGEPFPSLAPGTEALTKGTEVLDEVAST